MCESKFRTVEIINLFNKIKYVHNSFNNIGGTSMCIKLNEIEFQNRFKKCRENSNLSLKEVAKNLNKFAKSETIQKYENGSKFPYIQTRIKMSHLYSVSLDYMLCLDDYKSHYDYINKALNLDNEIIDLMILYPDKEKLNEYIANMIGSENI